MDSHPASRWLRCRRPSEGPSGPRIRLVCFPHAGGSASVFGGWADELPAGVEVWAVQYPGREDRIAAPPAADARAVVAAVTAELTGGASAAAPDLSDRPLVLFGHSMGAVLAYETARTLQTLPHDPVRRLVVSARHAPGEHPGGTVHLLDDDGLVDELVRVGGDGATVLRDNPELRPVFLPPIRADYRVEESYRHAAEPLLRAPVTALAGDRDPEASPDQVRGWAAYTAGGFVLHVLPGDHFYPLRRPAELFAVLGRALDEETASR